MSWFDRFQAVWTRVATRHARRLAHPRRSRQRPPAVEGLEERILLTSDLAEGNASFWIVTALDDAPTSLDDDYDVIRMGDASLRLVTASGSDVSLRYEPTTPWDFSSPQVLEASFLANNPFGFQSLTPTIRLFSGPDYVQFQPAYELLDGSPGQWLDLSIPVSGGPQWARTTYGQPDLSRIDALEIHTDTWDAGFTLWVDAVRFVDGPAPAAAPDLVVPSAEAPDNAAAGSTIPVSWEVRNDGGSLTRRDWYDRVYVSTDQTLDADDVLAGSRLAGDALSPDESYAAAADVILPEDSPLGDVYLLFVADHGLMQDETDESNNLLARPITVTAGPDADLAIVAEAPPAFLAGESFTVSWTVSNLGAGSARTGWADRIYFSPDFILDPSDEEVLTSYPAQLLPAGSAYTTERTITVHSTQDGYLFFVTDADGDQAESDESNNVASVFLAASHIDLRPTALTAPASIRLGDTVTVTWTVVNDGNVATNGYWYDEFYLSADDTLDDGDTYVDYWYREYPIAPGSGYTSARQITFSQLPAGTAYLLVSVNAYGELPEGDLANNVLATPIALAGADLVIDSASGPARAAAGQTVTYTWSYTNRGPNPTPNSGRYDRFYLSDDAVLDPQDRNFDSHYLNPGEIAPGNSATVTGQVTLPRDVHGEKYVIIVLSTDSDGNPSNNAYALPITIDVTDLTPTQAVAPSTLR